MTKAFSISQWLYVSKSALLEGIEAELQSQKIVNKDGDIRFALCSSDNETINTQYVSYKSNLGKIIGAMIIEDKTEVVLSISIKAYEYIPEISFSPELLRCLAEIGGSIDVDVINLIE